MPRTIWTAAGTPEDAIAYYTEVMKKVSETPEWAEYIRKTSQTGDFLDGAKLADFISTSETNAVNVFKTEGWLVQ
jgi:tripartite-type tricarboxylate transporter receptor subunit TctC